MHKDTGSWAFLPNCHYFSEKREETASTETELNDCWRDSTTSPPPRHPYQSTHK